MGMDVYARNGSYFRRSIWGWRPLADYIEEEHAEAAATCRYWHSNDGDGLSAHFARGLGEEMLAAIADGSAAEYVKDRNDHLASLPEEPCKHCDATGIRTDAIGVQYGWPDKIAERGARAGQKGSCNACGGAGSNPAWETNYSLDVEDIKEFAEFMIQSEGFEIC